MAKILIVDDQKSILLTLQSILQQAGYTVFSVTSAYDAQEYLAAETFDLVITDAAMPGGISGFELIRLLRTQKKYEKLPIILLTGKREPEDVKRGIESGASDYIIKPIDPAIILGKVNSLLAKFGSSFEPCPVNYNSKLIIDVTIVAVSEIGLTISSNLELKAGIKFKVETTLFEEIGIESPNLKIVNSIPNGEGFLTTVTFIGLSEKEYQPIRKFVANRRRSLAT